MRNRQFPKYPDDTDYTTNSPSYYDDLARKQKLIEKLAKRIWEYDNTLNMKLSEIEEVLQEMIDKIGEGFNDEINDLLVQWVQDGTLDHIINVTLMNEKADITYVDEKINRTNDNITMVSDSLNDFTDEIYQMGVPLTLFEGNTLEQFNQAINYSEEKKVPIFIPSGDYYFSQDLLINKKAHLIGLNTVNFYLSNNAQILFNSDGSGSELENVNIYGDETNIGLFLDNTSNITLKKIKTMNTNYSGIHLQQSKNIMLDEFEIRNAWNDTIASANGALYIFQCEDIIVKNGLIKDVKSKGVNIGAGSHIHVENVEVDTTTDPAGDGLYSNAGQYVTFKKCKVTNPASNALKLSRGTKHSNIIECNLHVNNSVGNVIRLQGASFTKVERNRVNNSGTKQAIEVVPHVISGHDADSNILDGNVFIDSGTVTQISLYGHDGLSCNDNQVLNHTFKSNIGLQITRSTNAKVYRNTFKDCSQFGISVTDSVFNVHNNLFLNNAVDIFLRSGEATISNNQFKGNSTISQSSIITNVEIAKVNIIGNDFTGSYLNYLIRVSNGLIVIINGNSVDVLDGGISIPSGTGIFSNNYIKNGEINLSQDVVKTGNIEPSV